MKRDRTPPPIIVENHLPPPLTLDEDSPTPHPPPGRRRRMTRREFDETIVWPLRNMPDELGAMSTRLAVLETRFGELGPTSAETEADVQRLREQFVAIAGEDGTNGKLGTLKGRVDTAESRRWQLILFALGLIVTAATLLWRASALVADFESRLHHNEQRLERMERRNRNWPGVSSTEETPP